MTGVDDTRNDGRGFFLIKKNLVVESKENRMRGLGGELGGLQTIGHIPYRDHKWVLVLGHYF